MLLIQSGLSGYHSFKAINMCMYMASGVHAGSNQYMTVYHKECISPVSEGWSVSIVQITFELVLVYAFYKKSVTANQSQF